MKENTFEPNLGGHPERMRQEGIKVHYNQLAKIGDMVEAIAEVRGQMLKGTRLKIADIIIRLNGNERGFLKRLVFENVPGEFNPQRFKIVSER
ncbi:MAG: hypothetical protein KGJ93_00725 [Patescibacteria group bacterium]|nr:hypothetical protein [Patescibacteria group bacterium]